MAKKTSNMNVLGQKALANKYPGYQKASAIALSEKSSLRIPSRIIALNYQLNGGIPYGKILEEFGEESTGKSLLASDFGYATQQLGGEIIWADAENAFSSPWAEQNGLDLDKLHIMTEENGVEVISDFIKDMIINCRQRLIANEPILVVIDSTAALECLENINNSQIDKRAEMGNRAKAIYTMFRMRNSFFGKYGATVILINQLRKKVGATKWEDPDTTPGGAASKFYASQRLGVRRGKQIKEKVSGTEIKVGQNVFLNTKKDKTGPPRPTTATQVYFLETKNHQVGFDRLRGLPELLVSLGIVKKQKSRYYYKEKMIANGEEQFLLKLKEDDTLRKNLIRRSGINTIGKTQEKLNAITKNLYPIDVNKALKENKSQEEFTEDGQ